MVTRWTIIDVSAVQVGTFFNTFIVCDLQGLLLVNPRNIISNIIMLLNINATRRPTDCCSATHGLLLSEATGLWDAESIIFNSGRRVASWTFTGRVFHHAQRPVERAPA